MNNSPQYEKDRSVLAPVLVDERTRRGNITSRLYLIARTVCHWSSLLCDKFHFDFRMKTNEVL
jgi:hypothetical protein